MKRGARHMAKFAARLGNRDYAQAEIVKALEAAGASVIELCGVGYGCPDLLVGFDGRTHLVECKTLSAQPNKNQGLWMAKWNGHPVSVVSTPEAALLAIGIERRGS